MSILSRIRAATSADNLPSITALDLADELATLAFHNSDFIGELTEGMSNDDLKKLALESVSMVAEGLGLPSIIRLIAINDLALWGRRILQAREREAIETMLDGQEAGDLDEDGEPIPYERMH